MRMEASIIGWKVNRPRKMKCLLCDPLTQIVSSQSSHYTFMCGTRGMDGGWTRNIFPLGSNSLDNHGAWMLFLLFTSEQPTSRYLYT
jgi:hypothetical protein